MNKNDFLNIISNSTNLSEEDILKLENMVKEHSYCSLPYYLLAKHSFENKKEDKDRNLQLASAYSPDRNTLKDFVTGIVKNVQRRDDIRIQEDTQLSPEDNPSINQEVLTNSEVSVTTDVVEEKDTEGEEVAKREGSEASKVEEVKENLEELQKLREKVLSSNVPAVEILSEIVSEDYDYFEKVDIKIPEDKFVSPHTGTTHTNGDGVAATQDNQEDLIERFLRLRPSLNRTGSVKDKTEQEDLSERNLSEDSEMISENLAVIMAKQGKVEKAIDIYKKLIWKYPQKKSYFADRIEELKK